MAFFAARFSSSVFVGFFFLLSGYVLSYNYADRSQTLKKRQFWRARFARLYPIYLLSLVLSFTMLEAEWHARSHSQFLTGLVLVGVAILVFWLFRTNPRWIFPAGWWRVTEPSCSSNCACAWRAADDVSSEKRFDVRFLGISSARLMRRESVVGSRRFLFD